MKNTLQDQRLIHYLIQEELLREEHISIAKQESQLQGKPLPRVLIDLGYITANDLVQAQSQISGHPFIDLADLTLPNSLTDISLDILKNCVAFPFDDNFNDNNDTIKVAFEDPDDIKTIDQLNRHIKDLLNKNVRIIPYHGDVQQIIIKIGTLTNLQSYNADASPLIILDHIFEDAIKRDASDIHFQPNESHIVVRMRIDGILTKICMMHKNQWSQLSNRLKVMSHLDIMENRKPQSGHTRICILGHNIDLRISSHPTLHGENIVIRLLDKAKRIRCLTDLGFNQELSCILTQRINAPQGMIIVTGPTGSGKTTTLYALLACMNAENRNIMTLESPIEAILPHIRQTDMQDYHGLNYADGIRSLLRQDPDVIMIGEIRDEETAKMAIRAVLTGHLVLSTMHTQDSLGVPARFIDLGISPVMLAGTINTVIAQRLIRKICQKCFGKGCPNCHEGYKDRIALAEYMLYNDEVDKIITKGANRIDLINYQQTQNFTTLFDQGKEYVKNKLTTMEEVYRVLGKQ